MATVTTNKKSTINKIIVAAIDFGTTYSGSTYSLKDDFDKDPLSIKKPAVWNASMTLQSLKTPTVILLNEDKQFVAFGFEAEEKYHQLLEDEEHEDYYYFQRFKMNLHTSVQMKKGLLLKDVSGKEVEALTVFSLSIKFLKNKLEELMDLRGFKVRPDEIQWVLTVPAIWTDGAKQFMRMAAEMAEIKNENLMIALEPEAASILCMHIPLCIEDPMTKRVTTAKGFQIGTRFMVVDMGGGTVDITVHEVVSDECLKELTPPTGGHWGGTTVDESFINLLKHIVGTDVYDTFAKENADATMDLYRGFEVKKRNIKIEQEIKKKPLSVPVRLVWAFERANPGCDVAQQIIDDIQYKGKIIWNADKFRIDSDILYSFFDTSVEMTIKEITGILSQPSGAGVSTILLVGGCSESPLIKEKIKSRFPDKRLVVPDDAGLAVLKGAVMYGHRPITIVSRIARYSYGVRVYRSFVDGVHPLSKLITVGQKNKCKDLFGIHVQKGEELRVGEAQGPRRYTCLESDQTSFIFDFYTSTDRNPRFVTDPGCTYIGQLEVMLTSASRRASGVLVSIIFGGTELVVQAEHEVTKEKTQAEFKFLTD